MDRSLADFALDTIKGRHMLSQFWIWVGVETVRKFSRASGVSPMKASESTARTEARLVLRPCPWIASKDTQQDSDDITTCNKGKKRQNFSTLIMQTIQQSAMVVGKRRNRKTWSAGTKQRSNTR
jgi:hypothetical protein